MPSSATNTPPVLLIIRDGWGENPNPGHEAFNAVKLAETPVDDRLRRDWPGTLIRTSGEDVGLPVGTMGNSEVGHQNIGAGRVVNQEVMRITRAIRDGAFFENEALLAALEHAQSTGGAVHLLGLVSDGLVHSDIEHLFAIIDLAERRGFPPHRLFIHAITDGRDVGPTTGLGFMERLETELKGEGGAARGRLATVMGRYYAMDRDHRWERIAMAYRAMTSRQIAHPLLSGHTSALLHARCASEAVRHYYEHPSDDNRTGDEFVLPTQIVDDDGRPIGPVRDGDAIIFFNFRGDRPRQLTRSFTMDDPSWREIKNGGFDRGVRFKRLHFCVMTGYEEGLPVDAIAFHKPPKMPMILGDTVSRAGLTQFRCAETEKFAHVTFFFNDYREQPFDGERRTLIPSPTDVSTYDQKPQMSAAGVCDAIVNRLADDDCEALLVANFANPDMVGHTGRLDAAVTAVETVDACVGRIIDAALARGGALIITADHGNAEQMWEPVHNAPHTAHTTYDVPLSLVSDAHRGATLRDGGRLADIAPTLLKLMELDQPPEMTGEPLF